MASYKHTRRSHGVHKKRRVTKRHKNTLRKSRSRIMRGGRVIEFAYDDGRVYHGEVNNHKIPHGIGNMSWSDDGHAYVYDGMWKNGKKHGIGKMTSWPKDMAHNHEWVKDMMIYDGAWVNDEKNGKGKYTWPNGAVYEGDFGNGNAHGYGISRSSNGDIYEGQWRYGKKNGKGKMTYPNGDFYEGEWNDNKKINGTIQWVDGKEFRGLSNVQLSMSDATYNAKSRSGTPTKPHL